MNLGINGLYKLIRSEMSQLSPVSGDAFIFFGKRRSGVKILKWDGDGFLLYYKRLEGGTFELPALNPHTGHYEVPYTVISPSQEEIPCFSAAIKVPNEEPYSIP